MITAYLNVEAYAEFHRWLGRGPALQPMWDAWAAGDRKGALAAIPDEVVDELVVHGSIDECRAHVQRYVDNGDHHPGPGDHPDRHRPGRRGGGALAVGRLRAPATWRTSTSAPPRSRTLARSVRTQGGQRT